jgi:hypothetical protein
LPSPTPGCTPRVNGNCSPNANEEIDPFDTSPPPLEAIRDEFQPHDDPGGH